jgi:tetratricopeptide (TPR) repeat protein
MRLLIAVLLVGSGCAGKQKQSVAGALPFGSTVDAKAHCARQSAWLGARCAKLSAKLAELKAGEKELAQFRAKEALAHFKRARGMGPYRFADFVRLHEQLAIAHSYLGQKEQALAAFKRVLSLSPGHAISYTLSPKTTFLFEKARADAINKRQAQLRLTWPRGLYVDQPVPVEVEVVADPERTFRRARLYWSVGAQKKRDGHADFALAPAGKFRRIQLAPPAKGSRKALPLYLHLVVFDARGNEVFRWASERQPYRLTLDYKPPRYWYHKWWVWVAAGTAAALASGVTVYATTRETPNTIGGSFSFGQ